MWVSVGIRWVDWGILCAVIGIGWWNVQVIDGGMLYLLVASSECLLSGDIDKEEGYLSVHLTNKKIKRNVSFL